MRTFTLPARSCMLAIKLRNAGWSTDLSQRQGRPDWIYVKKRLFTHFFQLKQREYAINIKKQG